MNLMVLTIIKKLRSLGLSQSEISKRADVPQSRISDIENGKQSTISYEAGKRLEALLEAEIAGVTGEKRRSPGRRATDKTLGRRSVEAKKVDK
jgi:transcriptional regulator with XRE-family HTH domain